MEKALQDDVPFLPPFLSVTLSLSLSLLFDLLFCSLPLSLRAIVQMNGFATLGNFTDRKQFIFACPKKGQKMTQNHLRQEVITSQYNIFMS